MALPFWALLPQIFAGLATTALVAAGLYTAYRVYEAMQQYMPLIEEKEEEPLKEELPPPQPLPEDFICTRSSYNGYSMTSSRPDDEASMKKRPGSVQGALVYPSGRANPMVLVGASSQRRHLEEQIPRTKLPPPDAHINFLAAPKERNESGPSVPAGLGEPSWGEADARWKRFLKAKGDLHTTNVFGETLMLNEDGPRRGPLYDQKWLNLPRAVANVDLVVREGKDRMSQRVNLNGAFGGDSMIPAGTEFLVKEVFNTPEGDVLASVVDAPIKGAEALGWVTMSKPARGMSDQNQVLASFVKEVESAMLGGQAQQMAMPLPRDLKVYAAKQQLKLRVAADKSSQEIGSLPEGTEVAILEKETLENGELRLMVSVERHLTTGSKQVTGWVTGFDTKDGTKNLVQVNRTATGIVPRQNTGFFTSMPVVPPLPPTEGMESPRSPRSPQQSARSATSALSARSARSRAGSPRRAIAYSLAALSSRSTTAAQPAAITAASPPRAAEPLKAVVPQREADAGQAEDPPSTVDKELEA